MGPAVLGQNPAANATRACALAAALALASSCSFMFSEGAPANHRDVPTLSCGDSVAPPVVDNIVGGLAGLASVFTAAKKDQVIAMALPPDQPQVRRDQNVAIAESAVIAALDLASAIYGYTAVASCRDAEATRAIELARASALPPPYGVPPYGAPPPLWPPRPPPVTAPPPSP